MNTTHAEHTTEGLLMTEHIYIALRALWIMNRCMQLLSGQFRSLGNCPPTPPQS